MTGVRNISRVAGRGYETFLYINLGGTKHFKKHLKIGGTKHFKKSCILLGGMKHFQHNVILFLKAVGVRHYMQPIGDETFDHYVT